MAKCDYKIIKKMSNPMSKKKNIFMLSDAKEKLTHGGAGIFKIILTYIVIYSPPGPEKKL
jgi:hypothetical protein